MNTSDVIHRWRYFGKVFPPSYFIVGLSLTVALLLVYLPAISNRFVFADEMTLFGQIYSGKTLPQGIVWMAERLGRPIPAFFYFSFDNLLRWGPWGLVVLRLFTVLSLIGGAVAFLLCLRLLAVPAQHAGLLTLLLWSQPSLVVFAYYSFLAPYWIGIGGAFASFAIFFKNRERPLGLGEALLHFALFFLGLLTFQMTPFAGAGFIGYFAIMDRNAQYLQRTWRYVAILFATVVAYSVAFKIGTTFFAMGSYPMAKSLMHSGPFDLLRGRGYFLLFEFWNYPFAIPEIPTSLKLAMTAGVAFLWIAGVGLAYRQALLKHERLATARWALALVVTASALLPIVAAHGDSRQHLHMAVVTALVVIGYGALARLVDGRFGARRGGALVLIIAFIAVGAAMGGARGIARPYTKFMQVVGREIARQESGNIKPTTLAVELLDRTPGSPGAAQATACPAEPCTSFFGRRYPDPFHESRPGFFRIAALMTGASDKFTTIFVASRKEAPPGSMFIDLNELHELRP